MDQPPNPAAVVLPKPSQVLRELLQHTPINWTEGKWTRLVPTSSGGVVACHCQGMLLANYAMKRGLERPVTEDIGGYLLRVYELPPTVLRRAMKANDTLDRDDARKVWESRDYLETTRQLAPKYLGRAIAVYEEAGK